MFQTMLRWRRRSQWPTSWQDGLRLLRRLVHQQWQPVVMDPPSGRRVLVIAPHMDDEVFGCGGTLARAVNQGCTVKVVFLTDGRKGYHAARVAGLSDDQVLEFEQILVATRKKEARRAGASLGFVEPSFLDCPDGAATDAPGAAKRLHEVMQEFAPDSLFLPFAGEQHPDHWAANKLLVEAALSQRVEYSVECWGYEVWTPLVANAYVDITSVMGLKEEAMSAYYSQQIDLDYARAISSLNAYRSLSAGLARGHVEAFFVAPFPEYRDVFLAIWPVEKWPKWKQKNKDKEYGGQSPREAQHQDQSAGGKGS